MHGLSFLTPLDALFALAAALPLVAFLAAERRAGRIRQTLSLPAPRRRTVIPVAVALTVLMSLVAVAAAEPVVVRQRLVSERADAQAFFLFDTSLSMRASAGPATPNRLVRAKRIALRLRARLPDVPTGIASMTDRSLPNLLPTTDPALFRRTLLQSVAVDHPPPSQVYHGRATTFEALAPIVESHFFSQGVQRRLLVVFTDGESSKISSLLNITLHRRVATLLVHVWAPGERIYGRDGRPDPNYVSDPGSAAALDRFAALTGGRHSFTENQTGPVAAAARDAVAYAGTRTHVAAYARVALAPWFVLAGVVPLAFLLWHRNA
ncbi:MAG: vWA domain-containing protein [Gaiellaceae bacterium]